MHLFTCKIKMIVSYKLKKLTSTNINLLIGWSNLTSEGKWGDELSHYWPTTDPDVTCNNFSKQTSKKKQAACFSSPLAPSALLVNIDRREGLFGAIWSMPTSGKPDMGCRRSGRWGLLHYFSRQSSKNKQAARFSPRARSRHPSSSISIDGEGFGACPYPESRIWAAAEAASGAVPHNSSKQT